MPSPELTPGTALGRYVVVDRVGAGGMGIVYAAHDPELDRRVAVKLLHAGADGEDGRARLLREAQAMARLTHPNVVAVHDVGTIDEQVFVAMELVDGVTLKTWMAETKRSWREVLATLVPAGRGLVAAHAAGLVHRDFKPDNVMIARDGRVVVMDFGLAAPAGEGTEGTIMGTPAYMAPEQHLGHDAGAAADQFAFCVTLYEALHGERPFAATGASTEMPETVALGAEILAGRIRPGRRDAELPVRLRRAVTRGLADDPAARWPSMAALLDELTAIARPPRWSFAVAGLGVAVAAGAVAFAMTREPATVSAASPCQGGAERLAGVWDDAARVKLAAAFRATGAPGVDGSVAAVTRALDAYFAGWVEQRTSACEDTRSGEQSAELLDRRMICLDQRFAEARALVEIFARADASIVNRSVSASSALTPLADCADREALTNLVALPSDPTTRAEVARVGDRLASVRALRASGGWKDALAQVKDVSVAADALHHDPLLAETLHEQANLELKTGDNKSAEADLLLALAAADRGRHDRFRAKTYLQLIYVVGVLGRRIDEGHAYARMAEAAIARLGDPPDLRSDLLNQHGNVYALREPAKALPLLVEAVALLERARGADHPEVALARVNLGNAYYQAGQYDDARQHLTRAMSDLAGSIGAEHPSMASALLGLGNVAVQQGNLDEAQGLFEKALAIRERVLGKDSPDLGGLTHNLAFVMQQRERWADALAMEQRALVLLEKKYGADHVVLASALTGIGESALHLGDAAGAVAPLERAFELRAAASVTVSDRSRTAFALARAVWDSGGDRKRARTLAAQARDGWTSSGESTPAAEAVSWLATHR